MAAMALRDGDTHTPAREALESALVAFAMGGTDPGLAVRPSEAGAALLRGHDRRTFIALARLAMERADAARAIDARLEAADKATEEAA